MRNILVVALTLTLTVIGAQPAFAEDPEERPIRASAKRLASETELQSDVAVRRSGARVGLGVALAAAGVAMLLIDPKQPAQPTQPGTVSSGMLTLDAAQVAVGELYSVWPQTGRSVFLICEPRCIGAIDEAISDAYVAGLAGGHLATRVAIEDQPWTLYQGPFRPFIPYKERSPGLKYGGAALAISGAIIAALWSTVPASNSLTFGVTPNGAHVGKTFGF